jgi:hypothetical protein
MRNRFSRLVVTGVALLLGSTTGAAATEATIYDCVLSGLQEVPANGSSAIGGGQFVIDTDANTVTYRIAFTGLSAAETNAHIHGPADPGVNAGVLHGLGVGNPKVGVWNYMESQEGDILAGKTYVNIHSGSLPGGEIRGQIVPLNASLDGAQENPAVATTARGFGVFTIDVSTNTLSYYVGFTGLSTAQTAAHIHGSALHGTNAGVAFDIGTGSPASGSWTYPDGMEQDILDGKMYVNVHTTMFPGGEIRGQIVPTVVPIDGEQEVPPTGSSAAGVGLFAMNRDTDELSYDIRHLNLSAAETNAHIHGFAPAGVNAGVLHGLALGSQKIGVFAYPAGDEQSLLDGLSYVNIHTGTFPGGEIRGQILGLPCPPPAVAVSDPAIASLLHLSGNAPNPFGPRTTIRFELERASNVSVTIFDATGRFVRSLADAPMEAGSHAIGWDARDAAGRAVANGVYQYVLETPNGRISDRMTVVR